jgi:hypothetical protein
MEQNMRRIGWYTGMAGVVVTLACGGSQVEQRAEEAAKAAEDAAKGMEQAAKGLGQMLGGASGDTAPVPPVNFRDLYTVFGDLGGWEKGKPTGEMMTAPVSFSTAEIKYTRADSEIEAKIVDSGFHQLLMVPYAMFLSGNYFKEGEEGWEKSMTVEGHPGFEKWEAANHRGELIAVVGKRFLVTFEGDNLQNTDPLHDAARATDLAKLASLK